jgi:hypothetical protein
VRPWMILLRLVGTMLVVALAAATAYGIGHVTKKDPSDLERALASRSQSDAARNLSRPSRRRASTPAGHRRPASSSVTQHRSRQRARHAATPAVDRSSITVAVINGTTVTGLARDAADKLTAAGFTPGTVGNDTTTQAHPGSAVLYAPGNRAAALDVAKVVKMGRGAVRPIDAQARLPAIGPADVVVMLGTR